MTNVLVPSLVGGGMGLLAQRSVHIADGRTSETRIGPAPLH